MRPFVHEALPGRVVFGVGALEQVADEIHRMLDRRRVLVVASGSGKEAADRIAEALGPRFAESFGDVRQHVPEDLVASARGAAREVMADVVVSVGGGSAIGLGKAIAVDLVVPLVAVPTTYSGSEMTPIFGITGQHKHVERDLWALPKVVVYDPALTVDLPARVTATSGFNALAHCVEALYTPAANPVVALYAETGARVLGAALPAVIDDPADLEARSDALYGALLAGSSLAVAGTALHHKLCHVLGGTFGLDHGDAHAVMLPHVAAFNAEAAPQALERIAVALGGPAEARLAGGLLHDLAVRIDAPTSLAALEMSADDLDEAAGLTVQAVGSGNPRPVDVDGLRGLLQAAFDGRRP